MLLSINVAYSETTNPKDFGFLPENTSQSNTLALQKAIDSSSKNKKQLILRTTDKNYFISSTIKIPSDIVIDFNNNTIYRDTKYGVFDMFTNNNHRIGNKNIKFMNLKIHGNKDVDSRNATNYKDRFSGIYLYNVTDTELNKIEVSYTVNGEEQKDGNRAGIMFENCSNITAKDLDGHHNDRTAIYILNSSVKIYGSYTHNNKGSGISGNNSYNSEYSNIKTHNNGYSQLSINGKNNKASFIDAYNGAKGYSNINIGHNIKSADASGTFISNVNSYDSEGWGLTVSGSNNVTISDAIIHGNKGNNIYIIDNSNRVTILNSKAFNGSSTGVYFKNGTGHIINNSEIFDNGSHGVEIAASASVYLGPSVKIYNNGKVTASNSAGVAVSGYAKIEGGYYYDNQNKKTQSADVWAAGGIIDLINFNILMNSEYSVRKTSHGIINIKVLPE
ncbi:MAG: right-handed parallel beta-helix repeat-containing protein [Bacteroidales bacterium]|nr:right-handed parallel beta-helix repeat-containing protein [Bacteroidales bacterium]